jgi:biotin carboxyl carrier protein
MIAKTETLIEALPYLQRYAGKIFVVKYGGHAMGDAALAQDFAEDIVLLKAVGTGVDRERATVGELMTARPAFVSPEHRLAFVLNQMDAGGYRHVPVVVQLGGPGMLTVKVEGRAPYAINTDWSFGGIRAAGSCNGHPFTAQVERQGLWMRVAHNGLAIEAQVMIARAAELLRLMPFKAPADMSKFLLSPMPGLLVDVAVKPGQAVQAGERLAVIEAMKMENILTASQDGVVKDVLAAKGESLSVDQPIIAFA